MIQFFSEKRVPQKATLELHKDSQTVLNAEKVQNPERRSVLIKMREMLKGMAAIGILTFPVPIERILRINQLDQKQIELQNAADKLEKESGIRTIISNYSHNLVPSEIPPDALLDGEIYLDLIVNIMPIIKLPKLPEMGHPTDTPPSNGLETSEALQSQYNYISKAITADLVASTLGGSYPLSGDYLNFDAQVKDFLATAFKGVSLSTYGAYFAWVAKTFIFSEEQVSRRKIFRKVKDIIAVGLGLAAFNSQLDSEKVSRAGLVVNPRLEPMWQAFYRSLPLQKLYEIQTKIMIVNKHSLSVIPIEKIVSNCYEFAGNIHEIAREINRRAEDVEEDLREFLIGKKNQDEGFVHQMFRLYLQFPNNRKDIVELAGQLLGRSFAPVLMRRNYKAEIDDPINDKNTVLGEKSLKELQKAPLRDVPPHDSAAVVLLKAFKTLDESTTGDEHKFLADVFSQVNMNLRMYTGYHFNREARCEIGLPRSWQPVGEKITLFGYSAWVDHGILRSTTEVPDSNSTGV